MSTHWRRRSTWLLVGGLVAALALAGCGADSKDHATSGSAAAPVDRAPGGANADAAGEKAPAGGAGAQPQQQPPGQTQAQAQAPAKVPAIDARAIIYTGSINVRVADVDAKAAQAITVAIAAGGFVGGDNRTSNASRSEAHLVLRVPSEKFTATVAELARLGTELSREVSTQDVTADLVDLDARIGVAQASVDRVKALLAQAQSLTEIVSLEGEVSRREADLESLKARQRKLADLTALSTITATLLGPDAAAPKPPARKKTGFGAAFVDSARALGTSLQVLLVIVGAVLPWLLAIGLPVWLVWWLLRRGGRRGWRRPALVAPYPTRETESTDG
jgi:hypothetical protein